MKYGIHGKAYQRAILDLAGKTIVSFVIGNSNNNTIVFKTFDIARQEQPEAKLCFIVTVDISILQNPSTKNLRKQE